MTNNAPKYIQPYKIGVMVDIVNRPGLTDVFVEALQFGLDESHDKGIVDRPVELVVREFRGQPWTDGFTAIDAFRDIAENEKVLGVAGPFTTDNCLAVLPEVERSGVPTITICGTQLFVGHSAFNLSNGGMGDEPAVIAAWLSSEGLKRIGVLKDFPSQIGEEYSQYFRYATDYYGLSIATEAPVSPVATQDEIVDALSILKSAQPDAIVYLGLGSNITRQINRALERIDWDPKRIMSTAFVGVTYADPEWRHCYDGWVGVDQYDERNSVMSSLLDRYKNSTGKDWLPASSTSCGYDIGRCFGYGLGRMRIATPASLRDALETIRRLPAATGAPGTYITFGPQDHRGYKGEFLVLRRAENGRSHFVGTAPLV